MESPQADDSLQGRMIRAAGIDPTLYDEVKVDPAALRQAFFVVLLAAVATGIGFGQGDLTLITVGMLSALAGWVVTAYLSWVIGARIFPEGDETSSPAALLRTIGFAHSPAIVRIVAAIPEVQTFVIAASTVWMLCATVIAIRQGLGFKSTLRATGVYLGIQLLLAPLVLLMIGSGVQPPE